MEPSLGQVIRKRRGELGLTQEELADRMADLGDESIRQSDISRIEIGQVQMPRLPRLEMLAQALQMDVGRLLVGAGWLKGNASGASQPAQSDAEALESETETTGPPEPAAADANRQPEPRPEPVTNSVWNVRDRAIRNAYQHLVDVIGDSPVREKEFEHRKAEFQRLVEEFERVRTEFQQEDHTGG